MVETLLALRQCRTCCRKGWCFSPVDTALPARLLRDSCSCSCSCSCCCCFALPPRITSGATTTLEGGSDVAFSKEDPLQPPRPLPLPLPPSPNTSVLCFETRATLRLKASSGVSLYCDGSLRLSSHSGLLRGVGHRAGTAAEAEPPALLPADRLRPPPPPPPPPRLKLSTWRPVLLPRARTFFR
ncbi:unnamed protein product, partial [Ectocarpus sp. 12 AP-2014]